jgi:hypothetical protein
MNRKQLILIFVALVVIGSAAVVLFRQRKESWNQLGAKMGDKVLPHFQPNDVTAIHIRGAADLNLVHKNGLWRVAERDDYPANFGRISDLLIKLQGLKVIEANTVGPSQLARVNLEEPGRADVGGTLVEFKDGQGGELEALLLGKKHYPDRGEASRALTTAEPDGRYLLLRKDPKTVFLISDALAGLEPRPESWLSRDFFKVENAKSISITAADPGNAWKIFHDTPSSAWTLADAKPGETLDAKRAQMITNALATPRFADVALASAAPGLDRPRTLSVETFDHFAYTFKISSKGSDDNYRVTFNVTAEIPEGGADAGSKTDKESPDKNVKLPARLKQEQSLAPWVYLVNSWILDAVMRDRAQILEGYKDANGEAANTAASGQKKDKPAWTPRVIQ